MSAVSMRSFLGALMLGVTLAFPRTRLALARDDMQVPDPVDAAYAEFVREQLRHISRGMGVPYELLAADYSEMKVHQRSKFNGGEDRSGMTLARDDNRPSPESRGAAALSGSVSRASSKARRRSR